MTNTWLFMNCHNLTVEDPHIKGHWALHEFNENLDQKEAIIAGERKYLSNFFLSHQVFWSRNKVWEKIWAAGQIYDDEWGEGPRLEDVMMSDKDWMQFFWYNKQDSLSEEEEQDFEEENQEDEESGREKQDSESEEEDQDSEEEAKEYHGGRAWFWIWEDRRMKASAGRNKWGNCKLEKE